MLITSADKGAFAFFCETLKSFLIYFGRKIQVDISLFIRFDQMRQPNKKINPKLFNNYQ